MSPTSQISLRHRFGAVNPFENQQITDPTIVQTSRDIYKEYEPFQKDKYALINE